jgi:hypothetical protein
MNRSVNRSVKHLVKLLGKLTWAAADGGGERQELIGAAGQIASRAEACNEEAITLAGQIRACPVDVTDKMSGTENVLKTLRIYCRRDQ